MSLQAIKYDCGHLAILDQLELPFHSKYVPITSTEEAWHAIKDMRVRGAPAIAIVAILSLSVELHDLSSNDRLPSNPLEVQEFIVERLQYLLTSRPTAVNLSDAARKTELLVTKCAKDESSSGQSVATALHREAERMLKDDLNDNHKIGANGAQWILKNALLPGNTSVNVLTHCNTGALATSGYGTALGVIRSLHAGDALDRAYFTETRPYNQGSRLTAFELVHDKIPSTLITDSMAAALLASEEKQVSAIVVGADRVAANGDTANKIGTYGLAVLAKHHGVKFLVAAPCTTIDLKTKSGRDIVIEERPATEMTTIKGFIENEGSKNSNVREMVSMRIAAPGAKAWNPAFDVTPSSLIDAIITEVCVVEKNSDGFFNLDILFEKS